MILLVHGMRKRCLSSSGTSKAKFGPSQQSQCRKNFDLKYLDQKRYQSQSPLARRLNQKGVDAEETSLDDQLAKEKEKQVRTPWHREGATKPPVARQRSAGAMTKGKLLTTPSRLLKLIIPLTTVDHNSDRKDIEPLALLVHPQQPLSYLERLIQSELPSITTDKSENHIPKVSFRAVESKSDEIKPKTKTSDEEEKEDVVKQRPSRGGPGEGGVESYSGLGRESEGELKDAEFVRWSASTEIGDFIRDAARAKEFEIEIEGQEEPVKIGVPSFNDRTYYLRMRLRKTALEIMDLAKVKYECDMLAHKGGQRLALAGFGIMVGWWYIVYRLTFETDYGWDTMEPVTYLVGLSTLISALNLTVSRRQQKLYQQRGFDVARWDQLIEEGNALRKEIKAVAAEYDVDWDEKADEKHATVTKALRDERKKTQSDKKSKKKDDDEDDE
ncbi:putative calcium uniporter mitochondrial [Phaeomoniella chlamydospora]|uniref:Calcium uniporter protein n=1 Tax=Phaeomoniella chlamydospora TaxID=158046 RepID=A0A0G2EG58_PHACM|nr:putative calcium uniporter mitochondrial [Phaeomoniella chlamydospora]